VRPSRASELVRECHTILVRGERKVVVPAFILHVQSGRKVCTPTLLFAENEALKTPKLEEELTRIKNALHRAIVLAIAFNVESDLELALQKVIDTEISLAARNSPAMEDA
jgi:hypothetical protein